MDILDTYFKDHKYPLTSHQLDSYREFLRTYVPNIIKDANPISMIKLNEDNDNVIDIKIDVNIGGPNGENIFIDRPILNIDGNKILLTPNEARLRNLTYQTNIYGDVNIQIYEGNGTQNLNLVYENTFENVVIGNVPIMVHSDACILYGQSPDVLRELKECIYDQGGYFIIDGKEKVIVSQERVTSNTIMTETLENDTKFSHKATIFSRSETGDGSLFPRKLEIYMYKISRMDEQRFKDKEESEDVEEIKDQSNDPMMAGTLVVQLPMLNINVPLILLFRGLGLTNDEDIFNYIVGEDLSEEERNTFSNFLRNTFINNGGYDNTLFEYINAGLRMRNMPERTYENLKGMLLLDLFPNIENFEDKAKYLAYIVKQFMFYILGLIPETDKDSYTYKRIDVGGNMLAELFKETYDRYTKHIRDTIDKFYNYGSWKSSVDENKYDTFVNQDNIWKLIPSVFMSDTFIKSLKGMWGLSGTDDPELGKVQDLSRISFIGFLSHLRRVNMPLDRSLKLFKPHRLHPQQWGMMCPFETPDGGSIGYLKNLALITRIAAGSSMNDLRECLEASERFMYLKQCHMVVFNKRDVCKVFLNGTWMGITHDPINLFKYLKLCKRVGCINVLTSISWIVKINEIRILTEAGRAVRPLLVIDEGNIRPITNNWFDMLLGTFNKKNLAYDEEVYTKNGFLNPFELLKTDDFLKVMDVMNLGAGSIEYVDVDEEDSSLIAMGDSDITPYHNYREIHPSTILSVVSVNIPLSNHTFAPRNIFHAAQTKQAIGIYATNFNERFDTMAYIQHYPQKALVSTKPSFLTKSELMPNGFNLIVAVMTYSGFNQEDSLMINRAAIERGLEHISYYKSVTLTAKVESQYERTFFVNPIHLRNSGKVVKNLKGDEIYKHIDENGFIKVGTFIPEGKDTAVIGMVLEKTVMKTVKDGMFTKTVLEKEYIDRSFITDDNYYGVIDKVFVSNKTNTNDNVVCKVKFLKVRRPEFGDKHSSRHGQKGVIGRIFNEEDMPFTKDGVRPDIIMNPHAFPSRMTIGHIVECVFAKLCCVQGIIGDGTVFMPFDQEVVMDELKTEGFDRQGNEVMYNGMTGQQLSTDIYIGPVYYLRLKHMVADKINARGYGPMTYMTRQPTAGRRKKGGLRIGEMERDALLAHGASLFIKESMMERSDSYDCMISDKQGTIYGADSDIPGLINIPYSFKQLTQEFEAMNVQMSFNTTPVDVVADDIDETETDPEFAQALLAIKQKEKKPVEPKKAKKVNAKKKEKTCADVDCPPEKICNPSTLRCVAKSGAIGKKLLKVGGDDSNEENIEEPQEDGEEPQENIEEPQEDGEEPQENIEEPQEDGEGDGEEPQEDGDEPQENIEDEPQEDGEEPQEDGDEPQGDDEEPQEDGDEPQENIEDEPQEDGEEPQEDGDEPQGDDEEPQEDGDEPQGEEQDGLYIEQSEDISNMSSEVEDNEEKEQLNEEHMLSNPEISDPSIKSLSINL